MPANQQFYLSPRLHPSARLFKTNRTGYCRLNNESRTTTAAICAARLAGIALAGGVLAAELDAAGRTHRLPVLPAVAGLHPDGGRAGLAARRHVVVVTRALRICPSLYPVRAGVVAV